MCRVTIVQGDQDLQVAVEMNQQLAASDAGQHLRYLELEGVDHFALIDPLSAAFDTVVWPVLAGLGARLARPPRHHPVVGQ